MDPVRNPYAPGAGQRPPELAGRDDQLRAFDVVLERVAKGRPERSIILTGLRGVGKTVLLNALRSAAVRAQWGTGKLEARPDQGLRRPLSAALHVAVRELGHPQLDAVEQVLGTIKAFALRDSGPSSKLRDRWSSGIDVPATTGRADSGDIEIDYQFLLQERLIQQDPSARLESPKLTRGLPKSLSEVDVEKLLDAPDLATPLGMRDKAMLETLYATGLRVTELTTLKVAQVSLDMNVVRVIGKGDKERLVPMGETAADWIKRYLHEARPLILGGQKTGDLFVTQRGAAMTRQMFWHTVKNQALRAGIHTPISPHTLRHAFATHLISPAFAAD